MAPASKATCSARAQPGDEVDADGHRLARAGRCRRRSSRIGLNYKDHAAEQNKPLPAEPLMFIKPSTRRHRSGRADRAARRESAASITRPRSASSSAARARHVRRRTRPATSSASPASTTSPRASCRRRTSVTRARRGSTRSRRSGRASRPGSTIAPGGLAVEGWVNGERRQSSSTRELIFSDRLSDRVHLAVMTLLPGDIISPARLPASARCRPATRSRSRSQASAS